MAPVKRHPAHNGLQRSPESQGPPLPESASAPHLEASRHAGHRKGRAVAAGGGVQRGQVLMGPVGPPPVS